MQLHIFNDASELALASVADFRITHAENTLEVKFIIGKTRVVPIKRMTEFGSTSGDKSSRTRTICQKTARRQDWQHNTLDIQYDRLTLDQFFKSAPLLLYCQPPHLELHLGLDIATRLEICTQQRQPCEQFNT